MKNSHRSMAFFSEKINRIGTFLVAGAVVFIILLWASPAQAQTVILEGNNVIRIENLEIIEDQGGKTVYDVYFVHDTGYNVYGESLEFTFLQEEDAFNALEQVTDALNANDPTPTGAGPAGSDEFFIGVEEDDGLIAAVGGEHFSGIWDQCEDDCVAGAAVLNPNERFTYADFRPADGEPPTDPPDNFLYFAQFADGGGLFSQITLMSLSSEDASGKIILRDDDGDPLTVDLNGSTVNGELEVMVPAGGLRRYQTDGVGDVVVGSVAVESDQKLSGVVIFGGTTGLAGVGASPAIGSEGFAAPMAVNAGEGLNTGLALMNLESGQVTITLELSDDDGNELATASVQLPGMGHTALFVNQLDWSENVDFSDFSGVLNATPNGSITATVIETRPNQFATLPVAPN